MICLDTANWALVGLDVFLGVEALILYVFVCSAAGGFFDLEWSIGHKIVSLI